MSQAGFQRASVAITSLSLSFSRRSTSASIRYASRARLGHHRLFIPREREMLPVGGIIVVGARRAARRIIHRSTNRRDEPTRTARIRAVIAGATSTWSIGAAIRIGFRGRFRSAVGALPYPKVGSNKRRDISLLPRSLRWTEKTRRAHRPPPNRKCESWPSRSWSCETNNRVRFPAGRGEKTRRVAHAYGVLQDETRYQIIYSRVSRFYISPILALALPFVRGNVPLITFHLGALRPRQNGIIKTHVFLLIRGERCSS